MVDECRAYLQACALRAAALDASGVPQPGAGKLFVAHSLVEMVFEPQVDEGTEHNQPNGCGSLVIAYKEEDEITRYNITGLQFAKMPPELMTILQGGRAITDTAANPDRQGYAYPRLATPISPNGVSLELWCKRLDEAGVEVDADYPYQWWAFPRVKLRPGGKTFNNGPQLTNLVGFAIENPNWYNGPANDWPEDLEEAAAWLPARNLPVETCGAETLAAS